MLHFLIFKTSLDSLGLLNVQSRARGEGAQKLALRRLVALNSSEAHSSSTTAQLLRSTAGQLLSCCVATVEQLLVLRGTICGTIKPLSHRADGANGS